MILFALHPLIIENSATEHVEPLSTFLLLGFVLTFMRALRKREWSRFILPGVLLGLTLLSLAVFQFFPVLAVGLIVFALRRERQC